VRPGEAEDRPGVARIGGEPAVEDLEVGARSAAARSDRTTRRRVTGWVAAGASG
jgi:hypothetical protein